MSVPTTEELAEFHRAAQRRVHALTAAVDLADSARRKVAEANLADPLLTGLQGLYVAALDAALAGARTGEELAAKRARDAWVAADMAAQVAEANAKTRAAGTDYLGRSTDVTRGRGREM